MSLFRRIAAFGGWAITLQRRTVQSLGPTAVPTGGDTLLATLAQYAANFNPTKVEFTCELQPGARATLILKLFRDGTEISATDRFSQAIDVTPGPQTVTVHWVDTSPGQKPIYDVRGEALTATVTVLNRRLTAET